MQDWIIATAHISALCFYLHISQFICLHIFFFIPQILQLVCNFHLSLNISTIFGLVILHNYIKADSPYASQTIVTIFAIPLKRSAVMIDNPITNHIVCMSTFVCNYKCRHVYLFAFVCTQIQCRCTASCINLLSKRWRPERFLLIVRTLLLSYLIHWQSRALWCNPKLDKTDEGQEVQLNPCLCVCGVRWWCLV